MGRAHAQALDRPPATLAPKLEEGETLPDYYFPIELVESPAAAGESETVAEAAAPEPSPEPEATAF